MISTVKDNPVTLLFRNTVSNPLQNVETACKLTRYLLLEAVKPHKVTGPDAIPARLLKDYAAEIAPVLTLIYQASLDQGTVPVDLKHAWVIPFYKKGDRGSPSNYRPISLKSIPCKTLEHIYTATSWTTWKTSTYQLTISMASANVDLAKPSSSKQMMT